MPEEIDQIHSLVESLTNKLIDYSPQLIAASIIMIIGFIFGSSISKLILRVCAMREIDVTLSHLFASSIKLFVLLIFLLIAIRKIGIDISPIIAIVGAGALGLTLAIQGPISNYGSGIAIILTRPFKMHDTLTIHGRTGIVSVISLGYTCLETEDGQEITIPNKKILGELLTNSFTNLVVEGVVGFDYNADPESAISCVKQVITHTAGIEAFGHSSINIAYRYWIKTSDYYPIQYAANLAVFKALENASITIPFPQRDVHIVSQQNTNSDLSEQS